MKWLYVENFRGFEKEFIPIRDVNFLLGENSTGKSSILALCNLFSSPFFWFQNTFNTNEYEFGNFNDIISINSEKAKIFRVGLIEYPDGPTKGKFADTYMAMLEYTEKDGVPSITKYYYITASNIVKVIFTDRNINYVINKIDLDSGDISTVMMKMFKKWIDFIPDKRDMTVLRKPRDFQNERTLPILRQMIEKAAKIKQEGDEISLMMRFPELGYSFTWIAPIRSKPKRTYDQFKYSFSPEGDHTPYLIRKYLKNKKSNLSMAFQDFLRNYGQKSGLMTAIDVKKFGKDSASPFELEVVLEDKPLNISSVGYGVSQSLPILVELFARGKGSWFAVQQPEVHLHPRAQAALGDVFYLLSTTEKKRFLIETHSDFIIDRFRINMRRDQKKVDAQVLFFERADGMNKVHSIPILNDGRYSENQPDSFRSFFIKEELDNLGIR